MKLSLKHVALVIFCAFAVKLLIIPEVGAFQALSLLTAGLFVAFAEYKPTSDQLKETQSQLKELQKDLADMRKIQQDIITNVSSVKVAQNMRSSQGLGR